ncbi:MAG: pyridoxal phosphate-dependent aminotransferase, partial [Chloroflexota bacterium]|nr:pyridoxal phosphate-dependent aminotransferase [Chloroflexota bacterium]
DLGGGDPDFATPPHIVQAAAEAMEAGFTHYVASPGIPALRKAIAAKLQRDNGLTYDPNGEIIVTPGGKAAIAISLLALVGSGDDVLVLDPGWVSYSPATQLADATPVQVPLSPDDNWTITADRIRPYITPRSRVLIFNSPNNPTGRVATRTELDAVAQVAREHDLIVISDEIYEKLIYDGHTHTSIASLPGMRERTIIVNGFSKPYAMTGWRLGYVAAPRDLVTQIATIHSHTATCATSFAQVGGAAAYDGPQECITAMNIAYDRRRRLVADGLSALPGITCPLPEGAFYAFADIRGTGLSSTEFATQLLQSQYVAVTPGDAFGPAGAGYVRLSVANSDAMLAKAVERIGIFVRER